MSLIDLGDESGTTASDWAQFPADPCTLVDGVPDSSVKQWFMNADKDKDGEVRNLACLRRTQGHKRLSSLA